MPAPAPLNRWVRCFWFLNSNARGRQPVVPDGRLEVVIHRAEPLHQLNEDGTLTRQGEVMVSGQLTKPLQLHQDDEADIVGIRFRTAAARDMLGCPLDRLQNRVVPLGDLAPALGRRLKRAARQPDPVRALSEVLMEALGDRRHETTADAVALLAGGERVGAVACALRVTPRTLERRIRADTGLAPKVLQRVIRFRNLYGLLQEKTAPSTAAGLAGYFDQAHANIDFRQFAGSAPSKHFSTRPHLAAAMLSHSS